MHAFQAFAARRRRVPFRFSPGVAFWLALPACLVCLPLALLASDKTRTGNLPPSDIERVQELVDELRARLGLVSAVRVSIVPTNARLFSVEADKAGRDAFVLTVDGAFLANLTGTELEAVVAHELGHVWIFTHHPYLQTEQLANKVAMRVVERATLEAVYQKIWERGGTKGEIGRFLGK
jgi:UDP-N-acetylglucosamine enolpyruvyl transferase